MGTFIEAINGYLWGFPMIAFLFFIHILMTVKTRFIQRKVFYGVRLSLKRSDGCEEGISPFSALATSLASTLGTGNIIGVSTAVVMGGAGAVFWCWITGILGMATQYCECFLSVKYREKKSAAEFSGGPMYVLKNGAGSKTLGVLYASLAALGGLITGAAIQTNAISDVIKGSVKENGINLSARGEFLLLFGVGSVVAFIVSAVIFGGLKSVSKLCSMVVPFMAAAYVFGCVLILFINRSYLAESVKLIASEAFSFKSAAGGISGSAFMLSCRYGISRGLFSNEAGIGTSSVICAGAKTRSSHFQGLISMTATFWDTVVMCLITGVTVVSTLVASDAQASDFKGAELCYRAFSQIPHFGRGMLLFSIVAFAISTVLGWSVIGEKCVTFIFGGKGEKVYRLMWVLAVFLSAFVSLEGVWALGDFINALLVIPNVTGLLLLSNEIASQNKI